MKEREFAIAIRDMSLRFGEFAAINQLALRVKRGSAMALLGGNDAGKTTLRILVGLYRATSGRGSVPGDPLGWGDGGFLENPATFPRINNCRRGGPSCVISTA